MAILRQEKQQYADAASLVAETLVPTANDEIYVEGLNRTFDWIEGSTATHDGVYVIDQTSQTANGRWVATQYAGIFTGVGVSDIMENGQEAVLDITVTGANPASANMIAITNADTIAANVFITSKMVVATDTVRITLENQSGVQVPAVTVNVTVLEFVKAATVVPVILNEFVFATGTAPSLAAFETLMATAGVNPGFTLVNGVKTGDTITFDNT